MCQHSDVPRPKMAPLVREPCFSAVDNSTIDSELFVHNTWQPFTMSPDYPARRGRENDVAAIAEKLSDIAESAIGS